MRERGRGGDKRKRAGQEGKMLDVEGDVKKVKGEGGKEEIKKRKRRGEGAGHLSFYVGESKQEEESKTEGN